jgi:hypothetical protein
MEEKEKRIQREDKRHRVSYQSSRGDAERLHRLEAGRLEDVVQEIRQWCASGE